MCLKNRLIIRLRTLVEEAFDVTLPGLKASQHASQFAYRLAEVS